VVLRKLFNRGRKIERRRAARFKPERLQAHYWTGGLSTPRTVREISLYGAAIAGPDAFYPGTEIRVALEDTAGEENRAGGTRYAAVWGRVVRNINDGLCLAFVFDSWAERRDLSHFLDRLRKRDSGCNGR